MLAAMRWLALLGLVTACGSTDPATTDAGAHRYQVYQDSVDWPTARQKCEALGGALACISSQQENDAVHALVGLDKLWLGGTNQDDVAVWKWIDGSAWSFEDWDLLQPDKPDTERWLKMNPDGAWDDANLPAGYVCEWNK